MTMTMTATEELGHIADILHRASAAIATLESQGYAFNGGQYWKPPLGPRPDWVDAKPVARLSLHGGLLEVHAHAEAYRLEGDFEIYRSALQAATAQPGIQWLDCEKEPPLVKGYYLVTVQSDDGRVTDILQWDGKAWTHEGEYTFHHSYLYRPIFWTDRPAPCNTPVENDDE